MIESTKVIAFSGKGGTGKTTAATLFLSAIVRRTTGQDILVIDADPDANLQTTLGIQITKTVGNIVDKRKREMDDPGLIGEHLRFALWDTVLHGDGFDFLVMGRSTGVGCYCTVNSVLTSLLHETLSMYDIVLIDFDAGLEHFSRRTADPAGTLIVVCDPSGLSFDTAKRIKALVDELGLPYEQHLLVGSRYSSAQESVFMTLAEGIGFGVLGLIPFDEEIATKNLRGESLLSLSPANPAQEAVDRMVEVLLGREG